MESSCLSYGTSHVHYLHFGSGDDIILALHGYGGHAGSFTFLEKSITSGFRLIAIDLPFHGNTLWNEKRPLTNDDLATIYDDIFKQLGIKAAHFTLLGYSMGGRLALSFTETFPDKVSRLVLLAPDGLKLNFWYWLATQTRTGNRLFQFTMNRPLWLMQWMQFSKRLLNKSVYKFVQSYLHEEMVRDQLYNRWTCLRLCKPDLDKIRSIIKKRQLPVRILYGKHDRIIVSGRGLTFSRGIEEYCHLHIVNAGHCVLHRSWAAEITGLLTT
ncbi:MAG: alpha/beta hydrolase [Chitinophagaceae bacterium]